MFAVDDKVRITGGSFEDFERTIKELYPADDKGRVAISIYGRAETIEVDLSELKPLVANLANSALQNHGHSHGYKFCFFFQAAQ